MEIAGKAAAAAVAAALCALLLRKSNPELAAVLTLGACAAVLIFALGGVPDLLDAAREARELSGMSAAALSPVLKCVGIGIVARLGADTCRDAGSASCASAVELAGALAALLAALPLLRTLLSMLEGMV